MAKLRRAATSIEAHIRNLYGSLSEEMRFEQALHRLGEAFRSQISGLHCEDFGAHHGRLTLVGNVSTEEYAGFSQAYSTRWSGQNLWMERSLDGFLHQGYQYGDAVVSERELRQSSYYRHFLKPLDIRHGLGVCVWRDEDLNMAVASFHRGHGEKCFNVDDAAIVQQLRPHLVNAYAIYRRIARLQQAALSLRACFERAPLGMLLFDVEGRLIESNAAGDELLSLAAVRRGRDGRLLFTVPEVRRQFNDAIKAFANPLAPARSLALESKAIQAGRRLVLHLCAVPSNSWCGLPPLTRILGFIAALQPGRSDALHRNIVRQVLGLSPAQACVALALRELGDAGLVAQSMGTTLNTVRSHLKSIHAKLNISRNGELLQMIERLLGNLPTPR